MFYLKINSIYIKLLMTILVTWFIFLMLTILKIFQGNIDDLPYLIGIFGIVDFALLFLTGAYGMFIKKKISDEVDDGYEEAYINLMQKAGEYPEKINIRMRRLYHYGNFYIIVLIITIIFIVDLNDNPTFYQTLKKVRNSEIFSKKKS